ncbi:MAG: hypothetical protein QOI24_4613 [Acidobacteriota bacterium]|jgi:hypothetical protein|nr:hypothetical protein [Acidobacteriota bacterium]
MTSDSDTTTRARTLASAAIVALLFALQIATMARYLDRSLDHDEAQYLHDGWLMHEGRQLYRDFEENHSPLLFALFSKLVPEVVTPELPRLDVVAYAERARVVIGICGLLAVAFLALVAWRLTGEPLAAAIVSLLLFSTGWTWRFGVSCARNDPPSLLLFWAGAFLLLDRRRSERIDALLAGLGIGLVGVAALWNPKWPLASLVLAAIFVVRVRRRFVIAILPPIALAAITIAIIATQTTLRDYVFFTFRFNAALGEWFAHSPFVDEFWFQGETWRYCGLPFKGWIVACALIVGVALPSVRARLSTTWPAFALLAATAIELRFLMSWPQLWPQYYLLWSFTAALVYSVIATTLVRRNAVFIVALIAIGIIGAIRIPSPDPDLKPDGLRAWGRIAYIQQRLAPTDTVWLDGQTHPIAARDATWYWYGLGDIVPFSLQYRELPRATEADLPLCRAERGLEPSLRFASIPPASLPESQKCLSRMMAGKRAVRTPFRTVLYLPPVQQP